MNTRVHAGVLVADEPHIARAEQREGRRVERRHERIEAPERVFDFSHQNAGR